MCPAQGGRQAERHCVLAEESKELPTEVCVCDVFVGVLCVYVCVFVTEKKEKSFDDGIFP